MEAPHNTEPEKSETELEAEWQAIETKIAAAKLTERERIVFNCIAFGGMSLYRTAIIVAQAEGRNRPLAKMTIARTRDRAIAKLQTVFLKDDNEQL